MLFVCIYWLSVACVSLQTGTAFALECNFLPNFTHQQVPLGYKMIVGDKNVHWLLKKECFVYIFFRCSNVQIYKIYVEAFEMI